LISRSAYHPSPSSGKKCMGRYEEKRYFRV
jgi:hypothetical protein